MFPNRLYHFVSHALYIQFNFQALVFIVYEKDENALLLTIEISVLCPYCPLGCILLFHMLFTFRLTFKPWCPLCMQKTKMPFFLYILLNFISAFCTVNKLVYVLLYHTNIIKQFGDCSYSCQSLLLAQFEDQFDQNAPRFQNLGFACSCFSLCHSPHKCYHLGLCWNYRVFWVPQ